jgi:hypothetical protein
LDALNGVAVLPAETGALIRVGYFRPPPIPVFNPAPIPVLYGYRVGDGYYKSVGGFVLV